MRILHSKKLIFISKPRCGSTSIRRFLDSQMLPGDEKCDYGTEFPERPELHPHMSAPAIYDYLKKKGVDTTGYITFTVTRHPLDMLWSYFNYFKPDLNSYYNYSPKYDAENRGSFNEWLLTGFVGIGIWKKFCHPSIHTNDFTPLSLEAHSNDVNNIPYIDKVFKLENLSECVAWLELYFGNKINIDTTNRSGANNIPTIDEKLVKKLCVQFPAESEMYSDKP
jgi:hypothetical protein